MKIRILFYLFLVLTISTFFWWTYSLITGHIRRGYEDIRKLSYQISEAELKLFRFGAPFNSDDTDVRLVMGTNTLYISTVLLAEIKKQHPGLVFEKVNDRLSIRLNQEAIGQIQKQTRLQIIYRIIEGLIFLFVMVVGYIWIYRSLHASAMLKQQQSNFLLSVTHELKTPLASIKLFLQTIIKRELPREQVIDLAGRTVEDTDRLNNLVERLLQASRIEARTYQYDIKSQNVSSLVRDITDQYSRIHPNAYRFVSQIEDHINVAIDAFAVRLALSNLFENAIKYSAAGTEIEVSLTKQNNRVVFSVSDEGYGIPDNEKSRIFTKFYRGNGNKKTKTRGTGLGLFIVREVLEKHNASISVKDNIPKGSIFTINFIPDEKEDTSSGRRGQPAANA